MGVFALLGGLVLIVYVLETGQELVDRRKLKEIFLSQEKIDQVLHELAVKFDKRCQEEIELQRSWHGNNKGNLTDPEAVARDFRAAVDAIHKHVEDAKTEFWEAHAVAKSQGFITLPKYSDYLDPEKLSSISGMVKGKGDKVFY